MADDAGSKAFCNGLTETLTAKLTQLTGNYPLQVVPTSEIRTEGVLSVEQARKNFGVGLVLEGSLHGSGGYLEVPAGGCVSSGWVKSGVPYASYHYTIRSKVDLAMSADPDVNIKK